MVTTVDADRLRFWMMVLCGPGFFTAIDFRVSAWQQSLSLVLEERPGKKMPSAPTTCLIAKYDVWISILSISSRSFPHTHPTKHINSKHTHHNNLILSKLDLPTLLLQLHLRRPISSRLMAMMVIVRDVAVDHQVHLIVAVRVNLDMAMCWNSALCPFMLGMYYK